MKVTRFDQGIIQRIIDPLIENVEFPRSVKGHAFKFSVSKQWAGEELARYILDKIDYADTITYDEFVFYTEQFRDMVAVYIAYNRYNAVIFQAALSMTNDVLEELSAMN